nr:glycosyltransferase [Staphylococcus arlettae]
MDVAAVSQLQSKLKITQSDTVITFIGRLVKEKGILELLSAFRQINDHRLKLIIIGDLHQSERDQMTIRQLEKYRNENNIIFTGLVHNVNHYLYLSDIFCLPSYREGMPRSILEAMAMKNAIIATDIRGCREEIIDGQHGYLVPTQSSDMIAQRINELITNPHKLKQFQDASYQRVNKKFNELDVVAKQLEIFKIIESSDTSC